MTYSVFIDGAAGTTGLQVHDRLQKRIELSVYVLDDQQRKDADARAKAMANADVTILCLPDEAAIQAAQMAKVSGARLIDASSAHRTATDFTYGFAEMTQGQQTPFVQHSSSVTQVAIQQAFLDSFHLCGRPGFYRPQSNCLLFVSAATAAVARQ